MPLFEFVCAECKKEFEVLVQGSQVPRCPACDGDRLTRKLSGFAVINRNPVPRCASSEAACAACCEAKGANHCPVQQGMP